MCLSICVIVIEDYGLVMSSNLKNVLWVKGVWVYYFMWISFIGGL